MEVLLAKERIFKLIQAWDDKQIESWSLLVLLLQLLKDSQTINEMVKQHEVIESSVKNLVPIPSEYEVTFDDESECDVPEINSNEIDPHNFNTESDLIESLSNHETLIESSSKFDYLEEFSSELMPTSIVNEERIKREHKEYISLMEKLLAINSFPRPLENFHANTINETLPTSPIPVEDELLGNDSIHIPENESSNFDHHDDPSFSCPPPKPPDVEFFFDFEPNSKELSSTMMNNIDELSEDECFDPGGEIDVFEKLKDDDYFPFIFVIRIFLPYLIYPEVSPLLLSTGSEDTIFDPGIST
nr:hypothetical protein [Tanacetum cinerariifolium]